MTLHPENLLASIKEIAGSRSLFFITDARVAGIDSIARFIPAQFPLLKIPEGEAGKTPATLVSAWEFLLREGATRRSIIVNIGGGSVSDLGGFAAATYMRGIDYINVPTTLLAAVDASIGGKTGIDVSGVKNLAGAFRIPLAVLNIPEFMSSLPYAEVLSGYGEMLKCGFLDSAELASALLAADTDIASLASYMDKVQGVKRRIVEEDPCEKNIRRTLNLGHTAGHALESLLREKGEPVPHGIAVAYGLLIELLLANSLLGFPSRWINALAVKIRESFPRCSFSCNDYEEIIAFMSADKKNFDKKNIRFALPVSPGDCRIDMAASVSEIKNCLDICRDMLGI